MRILAAVTMLALCAFAQPAAAGWVSEFGKGQGGYKAGYHTRAVANAADRPASRLVARNDANNRESYASCAKFGRLQCGCTASMIAFGQVLTGLPAVSQWLAQFSRTTPHIGAAAIWPGRHVEIVAAVNGDGTVDTRGSVGWSHVPVATLIFVDPRAPRRRMAGI